MSDDIFFGGQRFVSAHTAALDAGFTHDYISRLCRDGRVIGRRVGKNWYVDNTSLKNFLVEQEFAKSARSEALSRERSREYQSRTEVHISESPRVEKRTEVVREKSAPMAGKNVPSPIQVPILHAARAQDVYRKFSSALAQTSEKALPTASAAVASPTGIAEAALRAAHIPAYTLTPLTELLHRLVALTLALALTFGTYAFVDKQYAYAFAESVRDAAHSLTDTYAYFTEGGFGAMTSRTQRTLTSAAEHPAATLAAAGVAVGTASTNVFERLARALNTRVDSFVYSIAFPQTLVASFGTGGTGGTVSVEVAPYAAPENLAKLVSGVSNVNTATTTVVNQAVVERIKETERVVTVGGVTEMELENRLQQLNNKLVAQIYGITAAGGSTAPASGGFVNNIAISQRIDQLSGTDISNSTFSGGSITGSSVSATSLSVSGNTSLATTTITGDLNVTGILGVQNISLSSTTVTINGTSGQTANFLDIKNASGTTVFAVQPDGTLISNISSTTQSVSSLLVTGSAGNFWATTTLNLIYPVDTSYPVSIGANATSSPFSIFEVHGIQYNSSKLGIATTSPATDLSVAGSGYFTGGLGIGLLNTTAGTLQTSGAATFGGAITASSVTGSTLLYANASKVVSSVSLDSSLNLTTGTLKVDMSNPNTWTALQTFANASTTLLSNFGTAYFGGTATTTIDSAGNILAAGTLAVGTTTSQSSSLFVDLNNINGTSRGVEIYNAKNPSTFSGTGGNLVINNTAGTTGNNAPAVNIVWAGSSQGYISTLGRFAANSGSAAIPSFHFVSDTNTGFYNPSTSAIGFVQNGNETARFTSSGNFGIGTTTPWGLLSVNANGLSSGAPQFVVGSSTATNFIVANGGNVGVGTTVPDTKLTVAASGVNGLNLAADTSDNTSSSRLFLSTGTSNESIVFRNFGGTFSIATGGTVGSGAGSTQFLLTNSSATFTGYLNIAGTTGTTTIASGQGFTVGGSQFVVQQGSGKIGVGTASPWAKLSVAGGSSGTIIGTDALSGFSGNLLDLKVASSSKFVINQNGNVTSSGLVTSLNASTSLLSVFNTAYFGGTSTTTIDSTGKLTIPAAAGTNVIPYASSTAISVSDYIYAGLGTAPSPGYTFGLDTNTGIFGALDALGFSTAGVERARFTSSGYLGIGTSTPWAKLAVNPVAGDTNQFVVGSSTATSFLINSAGNIGIGTTSPNAALTVQARGSTGSVSLGSWSSNSTYGFLSLNGLGGTSANFYSSSADQNLYINRPASAAINFGENNGSAQLTIASGGNVGIGTTSPNYLLSLSNVGAKNQLLLEDTGASANQHFFSLGTSRGIFSLNTLTDALATTTRLVVDASGNVGVGTTTPFRSLSVTNTSAQAAIAYDATRYTDLQTNSVGDFSIAPSGGDVYLNDDNLWVCTGGSCPSGTPSGTGNLIVETRLGVGTSSPVGTVGIATGGTNGIVLGQISDATTYSGISFNGNLTAAGRLGAAGGGGTDKALYFNAPTGGSIVMNIAASAKATLDSSGNLGIGTTTPSAQLAVANQIFVGAGGATGKGTATSTFYGDIKIAGKLDVSTIDPPYTIDGIKYATYVPSMTGVKEETAQVVQLAERQADGKYAYRINFDDTKKGSDLWLFYQVTDLGGAWEHLTVLLTPSFDGHVYYKKLPAEHALIVYADQPGEVSMRLTGNRYDFSKWQNVRPDQDGSTVGTHVISSKTPATNIFGAEVQNSAAAVVTQ